MFNPIFDNKLNLDKKEKACQEKKSGLSSVCKPLKTYALEVISAFANSTCLKSF